MSCPQTEPALFAIWRTRDGQNIPVQDLSDDHLRNIIRALEEGRLFQSVLSDFDGRTLAEAWMDELESHRDELRQTWLRVLRAEAARRGLEGEC